MTEITQVNTLTAHCVTVPYSQLHFQVPISSLPCPARCPYRWHLLSLDLSAMPRLDHSEPMPYLCSWSASLPLSS
jgi:hypothetical protein